MTRDGGDSRPRGSSRGLSHGPSRGPSHGWRWQGAGGGSRGQLVLVMAVVVTVALVPIAAAYLQLGYSGETITGRSATAGVVDRSLDRAVSETGFRVAGEYTWENRTAMVDDVRHRLEPTVDALRSGHIGETAGVSITYNQTDAVTAAATACPSGPGRAFGRCEAHGGIVVQERAGDAVVISVSLDVSTTQPDSTVQMTRRYSVVATR